MKSQVTNSGHLYGKSAYAHFSQITEHNKHLFPSYQNAKSITYRLEKGDALSIPAGWWHWVKSYGKRCLSVNFWFDDDLDQGPIVYEDLVADWDALKKWNNEYLIEVVDQNLSDGIWLWVDQFAKSRKISMKEFIEKYSDSKEFAYLLTTADYDPYGDEGNAQITKLLNNDFTIPFPERMKNHGANFWMNFGGIDTGLHFDDKSGLLCVVEGIKEVTLFNPNQTKYLHPYPLEQIVVEGFRQKFHYNLFQCEPQQILETSLTSADLLNLSLLKSPNVSMIAKKFQDRFGIGNIVYSVKNQNGISKWEFYFYGLNREFGSITESSTLFKNKGNVELDDYESFHKEIFPNDNYNFSKITRDKLIIYSIDVTEDIVIKRKTPQLNLYYTNTTTIKIPTYLLEFTLYENEKIKNRSVQHIDSNQCFANIQNFLDHCSRVGIEITSSIKILKFIVKWDEYVENGKSCTLKSSACAIVNKREEIGLYLFGISYTAFIRFLREYDYSPTLIQKLIERGENNDIEYEIGFHFDPNNEVFVPRRTAFYGIF
tara:strand:+ start:3851 stop:5476 length:1626 start_codon:yes stop_codon:yes gene_type:complete